MHRAGFHLEPAAPSQTSSVKTPLTKAGFTSPHSCCHLSQVFWSILCGLSSTRCQFPRTGDSVFGASETVGLNSIQSLNTWLLSLHPTGFKFSSLQPSLSPPTQGTWPMSWQEHVHRHTTSLPLNHTPQQHTILQNPGTISPLQVSHAQAKLREGHTDHNSSSECGIIWRPSQSF